MTRLAEVHADLAGPVYNKCSRIWIIEVGSALHSLSVAYVLDHNSNDLDTLLYNVFHIMLFNLGIDCPSCRAAMPNPI